MKPCERHGLQVWPRLVRTGYQAYILRIAYTRHFDWPMMGGTKVFD